MKDFQDLDKSVLSFTKSAEFVAKAARFFSPSNAFKSNENSRTTTISGMATNFVQIALADSGHVGEKIAMTSKMSARAGVRHSVEFASVE
jgi:hypothetical protein